MRMWMVDPKLICTTHLLGEHYEIHMFVGTINSGKSVQGFIDKGYIEIANLRKRHGELVEEMITRKINHNSPLPAFVYLFPEGEVDIEKSKSELITRCKKCRERMKLHD